MTARVVRVVRLLRSLKLLPPDAKNAEVMSSKLKAHSSKCMDRDVHKQVNNSITIVFYCHFSGKDSATSLVAATSEPTFQPAFSCLHAYRNQLEAL